MSELIFIPTPNWFISHPIDINNKDGSIATCALNSILITSNLYDNYQATIKDAHTKRLHSVLFYSNQDKNLLASCSEDLDIKVWDLNTKNLFNHHKLHQNSPTCIDWLRLENSEPYLISCDSKGNIFKWSPITNEHNRYFPENKPITQIKSCPNSYIIGIGYKNGTICILDIKNEHMKIIHKLKNHQDSINCLNWYPIETNELVEDKLRKDLNIIDLNKMLCSSSEDKTIRIWCTEKGDQLKCLKAPGSSTTSSKSNQTKSQINYTSLTWPKSNIIISGSFKGELYYYDLFSEDSKWKMFQTENHQSHKKIIFDITFYKHNLITLGLDRLICVWDLNSFKQQSSMNTLNGFVYSLSNSPIDPNFIAVSCGDSSIKILNEKENLKICKSFNNNLKSEITQICWHPVKESIIAFGTKDGKVGLADVISNKPAHYIYTNYNQSVYTLVWCEDLIPGEDKSPKKGINYNLYSVADGKIMQHYIPSISFSAKEQTNNTQTINFYKNLISNLNQEDNQTESTSHVEYGLTEFSVFYYDTNKIFFSIGKFDGSIEIYLKQDQILKKLCTFFNHQKLVTCIKWNTNKYKSISNLNDSIYLATGSNDFNIVLIDFKQTIIDKLDNLNNINLYSNFKHKLIAHKERITALAWSKSTECNLLASCSYDSTVQVWNADLGTPIANYRSHSDKLLTCLFSANDSNLIYSGGEDYCLHKWRVDRQEFKTPPEECAILLGKKKNKVLKKQQIEGTVEEVEQDESIEIKKQIKTQKSTTQKVNELKSLFVLSAHGSKSQKLKLNDCFTLFENLNEKKEKNLDINLYKFEYGLNQLNLALFGNRTSVLDLLNREKEELKKLNTDKWWLFEVWKGNLFKIIKEFQDTGLLNDVLLNLYQISALNENNSIDLLNKYIEQLFKETTQSHESIHKAVLYCLSSYQVEKAIEIYIMNNLFSYALCLAHLRQSPINSNGLNKVLIKYAAYSTHVGDYETACMCYLRLFDFENAYKVLLRRNTKNDSDYENSIKILLEKIYNKLTI